MQSKQLQKRELCQRRPINLEQDELKKLDFNKNEYDYFIEYCNFTDRQKEILDLRRKGKTIIEITFLVNTSEATVFRELKKIKKKILKVI